MNIGQINEKYCLHDCVINKIEIRDSTLILCLSKGVYEFNANTGIYKISENCNIHMNIDDLNEKEVCEHVSINLFKKNIKKDISFNEFFELVNRYNFRIYLDFYSNFAKGILLKGYCNKHEIGFFVTEVNDIQFVFSK